MDFAKKRIPRQVQEKSQGNNSKQDSPKFCLECFSQGSEQFVKVDYCMIDNCV